MRIRPLLLVAVLSAAPNASAGAPDAPAAPPAAVLVATDAKQPSIAIGADGKVLLAFLRGGNIVVSVSKDRGRTFGEPAVAIDAGGHARAGRQRGPRIGVSRSGAIAVTAPVPFDPAEVARQYPVADLYVATSADGGAKWTAPLRVNEAEKRAPESLHAMAVAADGTVHVAWLDRRGRKGGGQDLWYARVADGRVGANARIAEEVCECCAPGLTLDGAGNPAIAWRAGGDVNSREISVVASANGGRTFGSAVRVNLTDTKERTCPMSAPAVALSRDGSTFAAAWKDVREAAPRVWWTLGAVSRLPAEEPVADESNAERNHPSIACDDRGTFWLAWEDGIGAALRIRARSSAPKDSVRDVADASLGAPAFPVTACGAGLVAVAWETTGEPGGDRVFVRVLQDASR